MSERKEYKQMKSRFYTASEVAEMLGVSTSKAYQIIRQMNKELKQGGYVVLSGKVPIAYFDEKCYRSAEIVLKD